MNILLSFMNIFTMILHTHDIDDSKMCDDLRRVLENTSNNLWKDENQNNLNN